MGCLFNAKYGTATFFRFSRFLFRWVKNEIEVAPMIVMDRWMAIDGAQR